MKPMVVIADSVQSGTCRSCGAVVQWATVAATGKRTPFNPPIVLLPVLAFAESVLMKKYSEVDMAQTTSHFATCPHAEQWRRQPRRRETP